VAHAIVVLVVLQRLGELVYASRNTRALKERGGIESGAGHYRIIVLVHVTWLVAIAIGIHRDPVIRWPPLFVFVLLQMLRVWVIATLGPYWTTRIITIPGEPLVRRGPYRVFRHPNYVVVAGEIATLPLVFGQTKTAITFSVVNAAVLAWRIYHENAALQARRRLTNH
jgi:methyltransferase